MTENVSYAPKHYEQMEAVNDQLHTIVRLLERATVCMAAPEIMDVVSIALGTVHGRYREMAFAMRQIAECKIGDKRKEENA